MRVVPPCHRPPRGPALPRVFDVVLSFASCRAQSLGASGAIFGVLGAEAILLMHVSLAGFVESIARTAFFALLVAVLVPNIDHMGHLGVSESCCPGCSQPPKALAGSLGYFV